MSPRGEVGIVVAALGLSLALIDNETYAVLLAAVILTTLVAPVMLQWAIPRPRATSATRAECRRRAARSPRSVAGGCRELGAAARQVCL